MTLNELAENTAEPIYFRFSENEIEWHKFDPVKDYRKYGFEIISDIQNIKGLDGLRVYLA